MRLTSPLAALLAALALPLAAGPTYTVNSTVDAIDSNPGDGFCLTAAMTCTLRAAVMEANHHADATITVPAGMYALDILPSCLNDSDACGDLNIGTSMTINGSPGTVIDANGLGDSIFYVGNFATLTLSGVTLQKSTAQYGAIRVDPNSTLDLVDSRITDCHSTGTGGGAITCEATGTVTVTRTKIDACTAPGKAGGAIHLSFVFQLLIVGSTISGCSAVTGGAIFATASSAFGSSSARIESSTISGNDADTGGGVYTAADTSGFQTVIVNSTISGNNANGDGGGIMVNGAAATLYSSTVTGNRADADLNGSGIGGGVAAGGIANVNFVSSIIGGNYETLQGCMFCFPVLGDCAGGISSLGSSLVRSVNASHCTVSGTFTSADPKLGPLQDNGGRTFTHALLAGSPAINSGGACNDPHGAPLMTDQRGVHRSLGAGCDMGAYESGSPKGDGNGDGVVDVADVFYLINYLFAGGPYPPGIANVDGDSSITVGDVFYLINYLFAGGPPPV
jgi:CSLREA domain-containing protein